MIVRQFHDGTHARLHDNGESSVAFPATNGVKQGCVLAPLFSVSCFLRCFLMHLVAYIMASTFDTAMTALSSTSKGFKQRPRWKLISSPSFCLPMTVHWNATIKVKMQNSVDNFSIACDHFDPTISPKKTSGAPASAWKTIRQD